MIYTEIYDSPLGEMIIESDGEALTGLRFADCADADKEDLVDIPADGKADTVFRQTRRWLDEYFSGNDPEILPPMSISTTEFRRRVWEILLSIPYGETMTYGQIARVMAEERGLERMSAQAVGNAVSHNPVMLIIPCHRVVGADGSLTGYAGGIERKRVLLEMEADAEERPL